MGLNDINSLSHTKWNCKYHIVFAPKYRRKVFYQEKRLAIGKILRQLCEWKGVNIIEAEVCPDHVHMLVEIPPKISVSSFMGYLKGKSATMIYEQFGDLKYKYRNREFWCKGYYVDTVGKNEARITEYVRNQLKEDEMSEQMVIPDVDRPYYTLYASARSMGLYPLWTTTRLTRGWFFKKKEQHECVALDTYRKFSDQSTVEPLRSSSM